MKYNIDQFIYTSHAIHMIDIDIRITILLEKYIFIHHYTLPYFNLNFVTAEKSFLRLLILKMKKKKKL